MDRPVTWHVDREHPDFLAWLAEQVPGDPAVLAQLVDPVIVDHDGRLLTTRFRFSDDFGARQPHWIEPTRPLPETCRRLAAPPRKGRTPSPQRGQITNDYADLWNGALP